MRATHPVPNGLNLGLCAATFALIAAAFALPAVFPGSHGALLGGAVLYALLKEPLFGLLHEADHRILHSRKRVNDGLGIMLAALMPSSFRYHRLAHLTHHSYNRCRRERVEYFSEGQSRLSRNAFYVFVLLGGMWLGFVITNLLFTFLPTRWVRRWKLDTEFAQPLPPLADQDIGVIRLEFLFSLALHAALVAFTPLRFWQLALYLWAGAVCYSQLRHLVHYGASFDVIDGAYDLRAPRALWPWLLHGNLHLAHHRQPAVPWKHLPAISRPEEARFGYFEMIFRQWGGVLSEAEQLSAEAGLGIRMREPGPKS